MHSKIWEMTFIEMQIKVLCISVMQSQQNHSRQPAAGAPCAMSTPALHPRPRQHLQPSAVPCEPPAPRCPSCPCPGCVCCKDVASTQLRGRALLASTTQSHPTGSSYFLMCLKPGNKFRAPERPPPGHQVILLSCMDIAEATVVQRGQFLQP